MPGWQEVWGAGGRVWWWLASIMSKSFELHYRLSRLSSELGWLHADNNVDLEGTGESITGREHAAGWNKGIQSPPSNSEAVTAWSLLYPIRVQRVVLKHVRSFGCAVQLYRNLFKWRGNLTESPFSNPVYFQPQKGNDGWSATLHSINRTAPKSRTVRIFFYQSTFCVHWPVEAMLTVSFQLPWCASFVFGSYTSPRCFVFCVTSFSKVSYLFLRGIVYFYCKNYHKNL